MNEDNNDGGMNNEEEEETCSICCCEFVINEDITSLPCNSKHIFHPTCIKEWLDK